MYYIAEIQENADGTGAVLTYTETTRNGAFSKYHDILHYAAVSNVHLHSAVLMQNDGKYLARETFVHEVEENA